MGVALLVLTYVALLLRGARAARTRSARRAELLEPPPRRPPRLRRRSTTRRAPRSRALRELTRLQLQETVKNVFFLVIVLAGVLFVVASGPQRRRALRHEDVARDLRGARGPRRHVQPLHPHHHRLLLGRARVARARRRASRPSSTRSPSRAGSSSRRSSSPLMAVQVLLVAVLMAAGIALQAAKGYFHFELGLYAGDALRHPARRASGSSAPRRCWCTWS